MQKNSEPTISFAGCGFLGIYHVGVATCLKEYAPHLLSGKLSGASAGSLVACALMSGCCLGECTSFTLRAATIARQSSIGPLSPKFNAMRLLHDGLSEVLPDNAHLICSGKLFISLTRVKDKKNVIISKFYSKDDLIEALICSAFVPFYCGLLPPYFRGECYVDGGLTVNIPVFDENTITVSPFAGESDICPEDPSSNFWHMNLSNTSIQFTCSNIYRLSHALFPPHPTVLSDMCRQGFDDALTFLKKNNFINCPRHLEIQATFIPEEDAEENSSIDENDGGNDWNFDENTEENDVKECHECKQKHKIALLQNLPPTVVHALQAACDSVNKGLFAPIYGSKIYKVVSLLSSPITVPVDHVLNLGQRFLKWAPYLPKEFRWFVSEFVVLTRSFITTFQNGGHRYSARFSCQLAVSELESQAAPRHRPIGTSPPYLKPLKEKISTEAESYSVSNLECFEDKPLQEGTSLPDVLQDAIVRQRHPSDPNAYDTFENSVLREEQMESILTYHYQDEGTVKYEQIFKMCSD
ncbi:DgyrCDS9636 [Dimorphilus gyrociliatus]|uniref:triacylglycerol lipase n=1 Tax=Dimorphilus gyrociliatus TaxID=2664684 RepID=A0A7I8VXY3_9ANNE|nr:DgyrCDS9636 [Dimorphilus gyrociliatus]